MATYGCAHRVGACDSGTEATVREVASCAPPCFCGPFALRAAVEVQSSDVFQRIPTGVSQEQVAFSFGAGGVVQEVLGTGQAEGVESSGHHRQGHRPESSSRGGGCRGGAQTRPIAGGSALQGQIDALIRERDAGHAETAERRSKWMGTGPNCVEAIPPMPTDPQELEGWSSDRNCDLRNAIESGNPGLVSQIGCLIGQGAGQVAKVGRGSVVEGQSRSEMMSGLIEEQSKRRCLSSGPADSAESIGARYGLRGVGEASNPGPPFVAPAISELCLEDVLASLEADLTMLDSSDNEPLVRGASCPCSGVPVGNVAQPWWR